MSASGSTSGGSDGPKDAAVSDEPPVRRHGTRMVKCVSETGEKRVVVYETGQEENKSWIDVDSDDVSDLSEMR